MALPGWQAVTLHGGPLDGSETEIDPSDPDPGVAMISPHSAYGPGGRSWYSPGPDGRWTWDGDSA